MQLNFGRSTARSFLSVSQITTKIKGMLELEIGQVCIKGEISNFKPAGSGHVYFNLKDQTAILACALFKQNNTRIKVPLKEGQEVLALGRISVYAPRGSYQLIVDSIEEVGVGSLQQAFEQLKTRLAQEGLFNLDRKKTLPLYPNRIAIVTSPTGAALQDMLNVLARRNSAISILIVPTLVQGLEAPRQMIAALDTVNRFNLADIIVLARGGGSLEDLWAFNDEALVVKISNSQIPVISAVGHETDFTLADYVADLRAPTPSAAAEIISKNKHELLEQIQANQKRLVMALHRQISIYKSKLFNLETKLISPAQKILKLKKSFSDLELRLYHALKIKIPLMQQAVDELDSKMKQLISKKLALNLSQLEQLSAKLDALSPLKVLSRGYTLIKDEQTGGLLKSANQVHQHQQIKLVFHDGIQKAKIL